MKITSTNKCIWVVDTIRQHKALTLKDLNKLWLASGNSHRPISRAGFYNLRKAALEMLGVNISTNLSTYEYYIEEDPKNYRNSTVSDWLVNTSILNDALMSAGEVANRIELEYVPSAREYLKPIIKALQENKLISFDYQPFTKSAPTTDIKLAPYFLKIFKQRWYVIGKEMKEQKVKTYALDRIVRLDLTNINFTHDSSLTPETFFRDLFGIESNKSDTVEVRIKTNERDAKYLRALPLHHSQKELVDVGYSIFIYRLKITNDLVRELLSMGKGIEVVKPKELRNMMEETLKAMLSNYGYTCVPPVKEGEEEPELRMEDISEVIEIAPRPNKDEENASVKYKTYPGSKLKAREEDALCADGDANAAESMEKEKVKDRRRSRKKAREEEDNYANGEADTAELPLKGKRVRPRKKKVGK